MFRRVISGIFAPGSIRMVARLGCFRKVTRRVRGRKSKGASRGPTACDSRIWKSGETNATSKRETGREPTLWIVTSSPPVFFRRMSRWVNARSGRSSKSSIFSTIRARSRTVFPAGMETGREAIRWSWRRETGWLPMGWKVSGSAGPTATSYSPFSNCQGCKAPRSSEFPVLITTLRAFAFPGREPPRKDHRRSPSN